MIVDPFLDADQLITLAGFGSVTRILTSDVKLAKLKPMFALLADKAPQLEVRWMKQGELHDRYAIPSRGHVYMLGSSLNSIAKRFGVATTFEESTSRLIAKQYDAFWVKATPLLTKAELEAEASSSAKAPALTSATVDEGTGA